MWWGGCIAAARPLYYATQPFTYGRVIHVLKLNERMQYLHGLSDKDTPITGKQGFGRTNPNRLWDLVNIVEDKPRVKYGGEWRDMVKCPSVPTTN